MESRIVREDAPDYGATAPRFIDLFCGIGGFRIAFEKAGGRRVFSSDYDKFSQQTYEANFGERPHGDIHSVAVADIPAHDILCGGFPGQPFSIAGVSKKLSLGRKHGFEDIKQGNLFFSIADIHRPAAFVLENVKNLKGHDGGKTFDIIHRTVSPASTAFAALHSARDDPVMELTFGNCSNSFRNRVCDSGRFVYPFAPEISSVSAK